MSFKTNKGRVRNKNLKPSSKKWLSRHINDEYVQKAKELRYRSRAAFKLLEIDNKFKIFAGYRDVLRNKQSLRDGQDLRIRQSKNLNASNLNASHKVNILELGAAPGGWSQIILQKTHDYKLKSKVVCVDLLKMDSLKDALSDIYFIEGDFTSLEVKNHILNVFNDVYDAGDVAADYDVSSKCDLDAFACDDKVIDDNYDSSDDKTGEVVNRRVVDLILSDIAPSMTGNKSVDFSRINNIAKVVADFSEEFLRCEGSLILKYFHTGNNELITRLKKMFKVVKVFKPPSSRSESAEVYMICMFKK
jgi:23S rRNA U2552 (ribose-2'-O)-methylase RlmE/FtsJ